ncbi:hypothetical protein NQZ68_030138, partial [Dissostichus eleginoides]
MEEDRACLCRDLRSQQLHQVASISSSLCGDTGEVHCSAVLTPQAVRGTLLRGAQCEQAEQPDDGAGRRPDNRGRPQTQYSEHADTQRSSLQQHS